MEGSYDILHDISCTMRKPITSLYRTTVIRRFWNTLQSHLIMSQSISPSLKAPETECHCSTFLQDPPHRDLRLCCFPALYVDIKEWESQAFKPFVEIEDDSIMLHVLSLQHSSSDSSHSQFAAYWKPILSMDANFWQRWLHMHRIVILLEHDMPVPKHLHTPGSNGRYSTIQCRISHSALTSLLRDWSSFVLVEGYSYVKLMCSSEDLLPFSFYVVRIISKAPCMVLRLGFPIGTLAKIRNKIVEELRDRILQLRFPHRVQSKEATPKVKRKVLGSSSPSKSPPVSGAPPTLSDRPCLIVLHKPLEKLLIRYEKLPSDYRVPCLLPLENPPMSGPLTMVANRTASSTLASLSRYFYHQRWIWCVQSGLVPALPITAVAQLLSTLTEVRLSEGFHFASSGDGIINMVLEFPMRSDSSRDRGSETLTCMVQYVLFPPHSTSTKDSFSTDDDNDTEVEAIEVDMELNLVTECWVEPQSGYVDSSSDSWQHLHGLSFQKIPKVLFPRDLMCIHTILAFEYISQLCQNKDWIFPACDPKTTATEEDDGITKDSSFLPNEMLLSLFHGCLQHDLSDREITLSGRDHVTFMEQVLQRDRDGHPPPFKLPVIQAEPLKAPMSLERQDPTGTYHSAGNKDMATSTNAQQTPNNMEGSGDDISPAGVSENLFPQLRCYAKLANPQHLFLIFLPATFSDIQRLIAYESENTSKEAESTPSQGEQELETAGLLPTVSVTPANEIGHKSGDPDATPRREARISFSRQVSQPDISESCRVRCPVYVYSCSLELLREQMITPKPDKPLRDIFFRSQSVERPTSAPWLDPKHKELVSYCTLLQEHSHQCYVKGLFQSLQQGHSISCPDLLIAVDYCEELLQEIDITSFLLTLCSHVRSFYVVGFLKSSFIASRTPFYSLEDVPSGDLALEASQHVCSGFE
ncbi:UNVERIFIED_CONTAM: hypothetical protein K2H54_057144 [Gekko kuhli]